MQRSEIHHPCEHLGRTLVVGRWHLGVLRRDFSSAADRQIANTNSPCPRFLDSRSSSPRTMPLRVCQVPRTHAVRDCCIWMMFVKQTRATYYWDLRAGGVGRAPPGHVRRGSGIIGYAPRLRSFISSDLHGRGGDTRESLAIGRRSKTLCSQWLV